MMLSDTIKNNLEIKNNTSSVQILLNHRMGLGDVIRKQEDTMQAKEDMLLFWNSMLDQFETNREELSLTFEFDVQVSPGYSDVLEGVAAASIVERFVKMYQKNKVDWMQIRHRKTWRSGNREIKYSMGMTFAKGRQFRLRKKELRKKINEWGQ